ncbi:MAG TPA: four helix bundle protein [Rubricoccaceae bacterium]|jgi:four helix bundle protein|nr:four helix bundle protein [Rubricoccaceae bacterium]
MDQNELKARTKRFGIEVLRFCSSLPRTDAYRVAGRQLMRAATSVGANYRAACRGRSRSEFIAKLGIVEEEADEALYWLEVLMEYGERDAVDEAQCRMLHREASEILAIVVSSIRTARRNR